MKIRDRIKEFRRVKASDLAPSPKNWRTHPKAQKEALQGLLAEIGFAGAVLARETPNGLMLIDGHLRTETAADSEIPVLILDVDEAEADKILATFDPVGAMAGADAAALDALLRGVETSSEAVAGMLAELAKEAGLYVIQEAELPELDASEAHVIQQMTFTVHDDQVEKINEAVSKAKALGLGKSAINDNSNGNALAAICIRYLEGKNESK